MEAVLGFMRIRANANLSWHSFLREPHTPQVINVIMQKQGKADEMSVKASEVDYCDNF